MKLKMNIKVKVKVKIKIKIKIRNYDKFIYSVSVISCMLKFKIYRIFV